MSYVDDDLEICTKELYASGRRIVEEGTGGLSDVREGPSGGDEKVGGDATEGVE